jgi:hypothetical protein
MKTADTRESWRVEIGPYDETRKTYPLVVVSECRDICTVESYYGDGHVNARLISAAPDMHAALQAIQNAFAAGEIMFTQGRQSDNDPYHPANVLMCRAMEKVRGENEQQASE